MAGEGLDPGIRRNHKRPPSRYPFQQPAKAQAELATETGLDGTRPWLTSAPPFLAIPSSLELTAAQIIAHKI